MRRVFALVLASGLLAASPCVAEDLAELALQPHPGAPLPLAAMLFDENGTAVRLGRFFSGRPVVVVLEYLRCKTLCGLTLRSVIGALGALPRDSAEGVGVVAIDIDPRDTPADAAAAKAKYLAGSDRPGAADIHFLTGSETAVRSIADAIGFRYRYDAATDQYLHPAGFVIAAPDGVISRYLTGAGALPDELRQALDDAAAGRAIGPLTRLLLLCRADGASIGRYTLPVLAAFTVADVLATAGAIVLFAAIRRRRRG
jgi:protein SCO1/2